MYCTSCWRTEREKKAGRLISLPFILSQCHSAGRMPSLGVNFYREQLKLPIILMSSTPMKEQYNWGGGSGREKGEVLVS